jgi:AcrR family transcriptional regulator
VSLAARSEERSPGQTRTGQRTRDRILDAADRLFGERGFRGTSMRALTREARVNLAAVNYHFGSKQELLRAALARHLEPINAERLARLERLLAEAAGPPDVAPILDALYRPTFEFSHASTRNAEVIRRMTTLIHSEEPDLVKPLMGELMSDVVTRFVAALALALPELTEREIHLRFAFGVGCMIQLLADRLPVQIEIDSGEAVDQLIHFLAAGFHAPTPRTNGVPGGSGP